MNMMYKGIVKNGFKVVCGYIYKYRGQFFIVTKETDESGFKMCYEVEPRTIELCDESDSTPK